MQNPFLIGTFDRYDTLTVPVHGDDGKKHITPVVKKRIRNFFGMEVWVMEKRTYSRVFSQKCGREWRAGTYL